MPCRMLANKTPKVPRELKRRTKHDLQSTPHVIGSISSLLSATPLTKRVNDYPLYIHWMDLKWTLKQKLLAPSPDLESACCLHPLDQSHSGPSGRFLIL